MAVAHIPVLRRGQVYESLDRAELTNDHTGEVALSLSQANAGLIKRDLRRISEARAALRKVPVRELIRISQEAGRLFLEGTLPLGEDGQTQTADQYVASLSSTSGLPYSLVRRNMAKIHLVLTEMETILRGLTLGLDPSILDSGFGEHLGIPVSFFAETDALGIVLPSNSPGVNSLWLPAIPLQISLVLKPGKEEPWTPYRIIQAFIAAGCPREAFSFYPTDHEGSAAILETCGRALIFGDESTVQRYANNPAIQVHGPGRSKVVIGEDVIDRWPEFVDLIAESIVINGGRSCVNASAVIVPRHGAEIADAVAKKLAAVQPLPAQDERAQLSGFAVPRMAEWTNETVDEGLSTPGATDVTARYRSEPRLAVVDGINFLLPTIVHCESFSHPLANREFLFPYASVVEVPQDRLLDTIGPSLVVSLVTRDQELIDRFVDSPLVERLNIGALPTTRVQWDQPHEGNLFEFLYRRRAIQRADV